MADAKGHRIVGPGVALGLVASELDLHDHAELGWVPEHDHQVSDVLGGGDLREGGFAHHRGARRDRVAERGAQQLLHEGRALAEEGDQDLVE